MFTLQDIRNNKVWVIGDTHFGHDGIVRHSFRPGWDLHGNHDFRRHNQWQVKRWNERVRPHDWVLHLGDVARSPQAVDEWCADLNGHVVVIPGNHDDRQTLERLGEIGWHIIESLRIEWEGPINPRVKKAQIAHVSALCTHYPLGSLQRGQVNLHGHTHGNPSGVRGARHIDLSSENTYGYPRPLKDVLDKSVWLVHGQGKAGKDRSRAEAAVLAELERNVLR